MGRTAWAIYLYEIMESVRRIYVGSRDGAIGLQSKQVSPFQAVFLFFLKGWTNLFYSIL